MLEKIIANTRTELAETIATLPLRELEKQLPRTPPPALSEALRRSGINILAEMKYRSPSRGEFPCKMPPRQLARTYADSGAAGLSVLTDKTFFAGDLLNMRTAREELPETPLLRKDFIVDPYQIVEAAVHGASAYLLIVAGLSKRELADLMLHGPDHQLEPLVEVHDERELDTAIESGARLIGINNRNLKTFQVQVATSFRLARRLEGESRFVLVSESGIEDRSVILELADAGFKGFLIGSALMESPDPGLKLRELLGESRER